MFDNEKYYDSSYHDFSKDDDIDLEPRLVEYLKKKKYNKKFGIDVSNLEKDFNIIDSDMVRIRSHFRGDKKGTIRLSDYIDPSSATFPSNSFKKDDRFDRIKKKQQADADAKMQKSNYGLINKGYDMYRQDRPFASATGDDFKSKEFHPNQWFQNSRDVSTEECNPYSTDDFNKNVDYDRFDANDSNKMSMRESNTYVHPKSVYNGYLQRNSKLEDDPHSIDAIIGKMNSYRNKVTKPFNQENQMDLDTKVVTQNARYNGKRETENTYQAVPLMMDGYGNGRDIDVDTFVRMKAGKYHNKSVGYPNPVDHYFNFISNDIQQPEHVVNMRGIPSRLLNKQIARPNGNNSREIMP
jgi:hypothetical protein